MNRFAFFVFVMVFASATPLGAQGFGMIHFPDGKDRMESVPGSSRGGAGLIAEEPIRRSPTIVIRRQQTYAPRNPTSNIIMQINNQRDLAVRRMQASQVNAWRAANRNLQWRQQRAQRSFPYYIYRP